MHYATSGEYYEGDWVRGVRHGTGTLFLRNGSVFRGSWDNDVAVETPSQQIRDEEHSPLARRQSRFAFSRSASGDSDSDGPSHRPDDAVGDSDADDARSSVSSTDAAAAAGVLGDGSRVADVLFDSVVGGSVSATDSVHTDELSQLAAASERHLVPRRWQGSARS